MATKEFYYKPRVSENAKTSRLAHVRIVRGMTQAQLAEIMQTTQPMINRWESGKLPKYATMKRLAEVLNCTIDDIGD